METFATNGNLHWVYTFENRVPFAWKTHPPFCTLKLIIILLPLGMRMEF